MSDETVRDDAWTRAETIRARVAGSLDRTLRGEGGPPAAGERARLGAFAVEGVIGEGGMGQVLRARDERLGRTLALKVARDVDEGALSKFLLEAMLTGRLEHPNVVPVHELGTTEDGQPFLAMKEVRGETLAERLKALRRELIHAPETALPRDALTRLLEVFLKVCDAVAFAHSRGVVHRDLKPANIMLGEFGEVLVLDWGLARVVGMTDEAASPEVADLVTAEADRTLDGTIVGTPAYMSPEQARGDVADVGPAADLYALGAILLEMTTLEPPFAGPSVAAIIDAVAGGRLVPPSRRPGARPAPWELEAVYLRAMAYEPADRYADVPALRADVERFLAGRMVGGASYSPARFAAHLLRRHRRLVAGVAAVLTAVAVVAGVAVRRIADERDRASAAATREAAAAVREREAGARERAQRERAERATEEARAVGLRARADMLATRAAVAIREGRPDVALVHAVAARELAETPLVRAVCLAVPPLVFRLAEAVELGWGADITALGVREDGELLAVGLWGGVVELWTAAGEFRGRPVRARGVQVTAVALGDRGEVAAGTSDGAVWLTRVGSPRPRRIAPEVPRGQRPAAVTALAFDAAGQFLVSANQRGELRWTRVQTGRAFGRPVRVGAAWQARWQLRRDPAVAGAFLVAHGARLSRCRIGGQAVLLAGGGELVDVAADAARVAAAGADGTVRLVAREGGEVRTLRVPGASAVSVESEWLRVGARHDLVLRRLGASSRGGRYRVWGAPFALRGDRVFARRGTRGVRVTRRVRRDGAAARELGRTAAAALSPDGQRVWFAREGRLVGQRVRDRAAIGLARPVGRMMGLAAARDGAGTALLVVGDGAAILRADGTRVPLDHAGVLAGVWVAGASGPQAVTLGGDLTGRRFGLDGVERGRVRLAGRPVVAASARRTARWVVADVNSGVTFVGEGGDAVRAHDLHDGPIVALALTASGHRLASASRDGSVAIVDFATRRVVRRLRPERDPTALLFVGDGRTLLVGDTDGELSAWDAVSGIERFRWAAHDGPVTSLRASADGRVMSSRGASGVVRLWGLDAATTSAAARRATGLTLVGDSLTPVEARRRWTGGTDGLPRLWPAR